MAVSVVVGRAVGRTSVASGSDNLKRTGRVVSTPSTLKSVVVAGDLVETTDVEVSVVVGVVVSPFVAVVRPPDVKVVGVRVRIQGGNVVDVRRETVAVYLSTRAVVVVVV